VRPYVDITFECYPLRSIARIDAPIDATPEYRALCKRVRQAMEKHGRHNTHYLCNARCVFHLTNDEQIGVLEFDFEGTVLTDAEDTRTVGSDLRVTFRGDVCDWLTEPIVHWFTETVDRAVRVEFDRYIAAGDLEKTVQRMERLQAESDARGGFIGFGL
jgi:hypothetical protein